MAPFLAKREVDVLRNIKSQIEGRREEIAEHDDKQNPPIKLAGAWNEFINATNRPDSGEATLKQYEYQFKRFAKWANSTHKDIVLMRDVSLDIAQAYAIHLQSRGVSSGTFSKHIRLLHLIFSTLNNKAKLNTNPWTSDNIARKRSPQFSRRELTVEELRRLCESAQGEMRLLFALGIYSGLRLGDCATLRWSDVDIVRNLIRRIPNKTARKNPRPVIIPIHPVLRSMLLEISDDSREEYLFPTLADAYNNGKRDNITNRIQAHFEKNGIRTVKEGTGGDTDKHAIVEVGFHSLRHTFVSLCRASNAPLSVVEAIVGHSNPAMTRHYTHTGELAAASAVNLLPNVIGDDNQIPTPIKTITIDPAPIRAGLETMTDKNWKAKRDELLSLLKESILEKQKT